MHMSDAFADEFQRSTIILQPGEGEVVPGPVGPMIIIKAMREDTGGIIGVFESIIAPKNGPPVHFHRNADETFYILQGMFKFRVGSKVFSAGPGTFIFVPRGVAHAFLNIGYDFAKLLVIYTPGGLEVAAAEQARMMGHMSDPGEILEPTIVRALAQKYDSEFVGPPLEP